VSAKVSIALYVLVSFLCPVIRAQDGRFIKSLQIAGTARRVQLETHAGQSLDRGRVTRDVRRLWATGWFEDIRVESRETRKGVQLFFTLVEKPRLYLHRVQAEPKLTGSLGIELGAAVDTLLAHQVAAVLWRQWVDDGYADARVEAELVPVGFQQADLRLQVAPGRRHRVEEVKFSGAPGLESEELKRALRSTRIRRWLPGVPGLWRGWRARPPYSERAVAADLERLQSLHLSHGYFDARVGLTEVESAEGDVTLTIGVEPGQRYRVRRTDIVGASPGPEIEPLISGSFPGGELCRCFLEEQRKSEQQGEVGFSGQLEIEATDEPPWARLADAFGQREESANQGEEDRPHRGQRWVAVTANVRTGPAYAVGRIDFRGHHAFSDLTLRRALTLHEGDLFDWGQLRSSLARLSRLGFLEPVTENDVRLTREPAGRRLHLTITVREKPRGRWLLSGPLGSTSVSGPFQFAIGSRLPAWGRGPLELSTYYATFNLFAFLPPAISLLLLAPQTGLRPLVAVERPYLPGQGWQSGFLLSPQLGWRGMLSHYGLTQARKTVQSALESDRSTSAMTVPVMWRDGRDERSEAELRPAGTLLCEAAPPRWAWLQTGGMTALDWLLKSYPF
jgi:outer membrane protein insertion porin family